MSASKQRPLWQDLPLRLRQQIEGVVGGPVVAAVNCPGGFSPGFASRLTIAGGMRAFAKAIDARAWPLHAATYRDEAHNAAALTEAGFAHALPTPRFLGTCDDGSHVVLAFECVDGHEPASPWQSGQLATVAAAVRRMAALLTPSPLPAPSDHPRLAAGLVLGPGSWADCEPR